MFGLGIHELLIIGVVAVLLFGKRLPEVARSLGKSYNQFRHGLSDIQSELDISSHINSVGSETFTSSFDSNDDHKSFDEDERDIPTAPKFEPPPAEPQDSTETAEPTGDNSSASDQ